MVPSDNGSSDNASNAMPGGDSKGVTPDSEDRVKDFWSRHGGPGARNSDQGEIVAGICGWSEVYAADGYTLRSEWSCIGGRQEIQYLEKPPRS